MMSRTDRAKQAALYLEQARTAALRIYEKLSAQFEKTYAEVWHRRELWGYVQNVMDFGTLQPQHATSTAKTLDKLLAINRALSQDHNPDRLLERIIDAAIALSGAERGFIILKSEDADELVMRAARNLDHVDMSGDDLEFSRSIAIEAMDRGAPVTTTDAQGDDRFNEFRSVHNLKLRSVLCLPLSAPPAIRGALYLDHRHRVNAFTDADTSMLGAFGDQAAIALANAQLVSELRANSSELESSRATIEELNQRLNQELEAQQAELDAIRESRGEPAESDEVSQFGMIGKSKGMQKVFRIISRVADKEVPVTVLGESGTGKELVARAIHSTAGDRRPGQFVSVNCGAITPQLWESELFGHEKGAFTGAVRAKPGLVEIADKGTLFLDEIGDMPLDMQVKLLRLLQQHEYRRVGGTRTLISTARIICATNCDLEAMVRESTFREDLWYRLNVVEVELPSLRERREDVALLIDHLLSKHGGNNPPTLTRQARAALLDYSWPGNIRELENEVMRAVALADNDILPDDLSTKLASARPMPALPSRDGPLKDQVAGFEAMIIRETLESVEGRVVKAAERLGLTRAGLYKKINKHGISVNN
jgi:transcriptional regulator with GAF, ATPase, and Fis domain